MLGKGVEVNHKRSSHAARTACQAGQPFACSLLANHYQDGISVAWNPSHAVTLYERACEQGIGVACYNLASMYLVGHGVVLNEEKGRELLARSTEAWKKQCATEPRWCTNYSYALRQSGAPAEDTAQVVRDACERGNALSCTQHAHTQWGNGELDQADFTAKMTELCKRNEPYACHTLAYQNNQRRVRLLRKSCNLGNKGACGILPKLLGTAESKTYGQRACKMGLIDSCHDLALDATRRNDVDEAIQFGKIACLRGGPNCRSAQQLVSKFRSKTDQDAQLLAKEACRRQTVESCIGLLVAGQDVPLASAKRKQVLTEACNGGVKHACTLLDNSP